MEEPVQALLRGLRDTFFRNRLYRVAVGKDPKKEVNATLDLIDTVLKGHWLACACDVLAMSNPDDRVALPAGSAKDFIHEVAEKVVDRCTVLESAFPPADVCEPDDTAYNYARLLCHYCSLVKEFRDAWAEGDGERVLRCWKIFMPHFQAAGCHKYCLEALRLQFQVNGLLPPNLAHQVMWHRFVNIKGGPGRNISCDLHNEHMNKLIKLIISNMGSNLTEASLQRAVRCVSILHSISVKFDEETGVPFRTTAHSTRPDTQDVKIVTAVVRREKLLQPIQGRKHASFPHLSLNPLKKWNVGKSKTWIEAKQRHYLKLKGSFQAIESNSDDSD